MSERFPYLDRFYVLEDDGSYRKATSLSEIEGIWESDKRIIERTEIAPDVVVSTVFLVVDHQMSGGFPLLFETMVFGGALDMHQERHSTITEAREHHKEIVNRIAWGQDDG